MACICVVASCSSWQARASLELAAACCADVVDDDDDDDDDDECELAVAVVADVCSTVLK